MSVALKIKLGNGVVKTIRFAPEMSVSEACETILEKTSEGGADHGLFLPSVEGRTPAKWLVPEKTLQFYDLQSDTLLEYRKKHRARKVKLLDDTIKTIMLDESASVQESVDAISDRIGIKNPEEFSLQKEGADWLKSTSILGEIGIGDEDVLVLKKKFFFHDANIDRNDPVQLHMLFIQCRDSVVESKYPTTKDEARDLAAIQAQVTFGDHTPARTQGSWLNLKEFLPAHYQKVKGIEKEVAKEYRKLTGMSEVNAKYRYVQLCRSLKTYGITSFNVKVRDPDKKNKLKDIILGVTRESVIFMDFETKETKTTYKLTQIKRWAAADKSFTFDFGDYQMDYTTLYTLESEQIAQLISGYIEIILKTRRDAGKILADKENLVGSEERIAVNRGAAGKGVSMSTSGAHSGLTGPQYTSATGHMHGSQVPASQQIAITDLNSAVRATDLLLAELEAASNAPTRPGGQYSTTLTPQQYKQQLMSNAGNAATLAMAMLNDLNNPPAGGMQALRAQLTSKAQQVMSCLSIVGKNAQNAIYVNGVSDQAMDIMDASKKLASSIAKMMKAAVSASEGGGEEAKLQLAQATYAAHATGLLMITACGEGYASPHSQTLIEECAKAVAACGMLLHDLSAAQAEQADEHLRPELMDSIGRLRNANEQLSITAEILAPVSANADAAKRIAEISQEASLQARGIMSGFRKTTTLSQPLLDALSARAQDLLASMDLLTVSVECADRRGHAQGVDSNADIGEEFTSASTSLTQAFAGLKGVSGDVRLLQDRVAEIAAATNKLVACSRAVAARADSTTQNRLLLAAKASLDAMNNLSNACKTALLNPGDEAARDKMMEAAAYLQSVNQQMIADAGKIASVSSLCDSAKQMVAMVTTLTSSVRAASVDLPPTIGQPIEKNAREVVEALPRLVTTVKRVIQNPHSDKAQVDLLETAQRAALPPMNLVAASRRFLPKVSDPNTKQSIVYAADSTTQAVQKLMAACQTFKQIGGHIEIEEALESFAATLAELDTAEIAAQGGFLEVLPGQTRENTVELLTMAIKSLNASNAHLNETAKTNPTQLGTAVKACTNSAGQVALAAKGVASTTPGKAAQKKILATAKSFASHMEQLVRAARTLSSNPNDSSAGLLMDSSLQDVSSSLALLVGSSAQIDSRELDEASAAISQLASTLSLSASHTPNPTKFQANKEELESAVKALNAAILQVVGMARNKNLKGLGSAAKITSSTFPAIVQAAIATASSTDTEANREAIIVGTQGLAQQVAALFDHAKARLVNSKDPVYDQNLTQGAKNVVEAASKLQRSLGSTANKDCEDAIDAILGSSEKIEASSLQELQTLSTQTPDALVMVHQAALQAVATHARQLGNSTRAIVSDASTGSAQLGESSRIAAEQVAMLVEAANRVFCATACSVPQSVFAPAKNILDADVLLLNAGGNIPQIINSTRLVSTATQQLLQAAKDRAGTYENKSEVQEKLLLTSQRVAACTANLAKAAKALASKQADGPSLMTAAVKDLDAATKALLLAASYPAEQQTAMNIVDQVMQLLSSTRNVATSSSTLISASMHVSARPRDSNLQSQMSDAAASLANTIKELLKASATMMPGVIECQEAAEMAQKASAELTSVSLAIAVGSFDASIGKGVPLQKAQEDLVSTANHIGNGVFQLGRASRQSPDAIGKCAIQVASLLSSFVNQAKIAAAGTSDSELQTQLVEKAKSVVDRILDTAQAANRASSNPSKETYGEVLKRVEQAEQQIGSLVSDLASDVNHLRDLDEAVDRVSKSGQQIDSRPTVDGATSYQEWKDELNNKAKSLATVLRNIVASDKGNVVLIGNAAKEIAELMPAVIDAVRQASAHTADNAVKTQLAASAKQLVAATVDILKSTKLANTEKANTAHIQAIGQHFKTGTTAITKMLQVAKQGAVGEVMSDSAVDQISKAISDIEAFSLVAAAGQLLEGEEGSQQQTQAVVAQKEMFNTAKALIVASSQFVGSTKGSQEQLGAAAGGVSATVVKLVGHSKDFAAGLNETVLQQEVLTAAKAVGLASQQLVLAGKDAQRVKKDPTAARSLSKAAEGLAESVGGLVNRAHGALAEAQKGLREMDSVHGKIQSILTQFDQLPANDHATAVDLASSARAVADSSAQMVSAYHVSQEELAKAAALVYTSNAKLLSNSKGATRLVNDEATKQRLLDRAKAVSASLLSLLASVRDQSKDPHNASKNIHEASDAVAYGISDMVKLSRTLPGGSSIQVEEAELDSEDLEEVAEKELFNAAKQIEAAAAALLAARPKPKPKAAGVMLDSQDIAATIVDATTTIAQAVAKLVSSAAVAQSKRRQATKISGRYRRDPVWANGLISAARAVAQSTHQLVQAANKAAQGKAEEEELIATARAVAAATAQLVAASRAKSGEDQGSHAAVSGAAKAVAAATSHLVSAAKAATAFQEQEAAEVQEEYNFTGSKVKELEQQMKILKLEKELEQARKQMLTSRKQANYGNQP